MMVTVREDLVGQPSGFYNTTPADLNLPITKAIDVTDIGKPEIPGSELVITYVNYPDGIVIQYHGIYEGRKMFFEQFHDTEDIEFATTFQHVVRWFGISLAELLEITFENAPY